MIAKLNARLDAYFGSHFWPYVIKEIVWGGSQIVWAALEWLFLGVGFFLFFYVLVPILRITGLEPWFRDFGYRHFLKFRQATENEIENGVIICPCCSKIIKRKLTVCPHCQSKIWRHEADSDLWWWNREKVDWE